MKPEVKYYLRKETEMNNQHQDEDQCAISIQVHPNPSSSYQEIVTQTYDYMIKNKIAVWFMLGPMRVVIKPDNTKSLFCYMKAVEDALKELERRELNKQNNKPKLVVSHDVKPVQAIITSVPPNGPFAA
jgi:hypothetical protein